MPPIAALVILMVGIATAEVAAGVMEAVVAEAIKHPGKRVKTLLKEYNKTQDDLAQALHVSRFSVNQIINNRRAITPFMAIRLACVFEEISAAEWMQQQAVYDLQAECEEHSLDDIKASIQPWSRP